MLHLYMEVWPSSSIVPISREHYAHIRARRLRDCEPVKLINGHGDWQDGTLSLQDSTILITKTGYQEPPFKKKYVAFGWCKSQTMDWIVEKSVEMGVTDIIPLLTDYVGHKPKDSDVIKRYERFHAIIRAALCQCGSYYAPVIHPVIAVDNIRTYHPDTAWALLDARGTTPDALQSNTWGVLVGPEGGWSEREYAHMSCWANGIWCVAPHVLRVETAAIAGMTLMNMDY